MQNVLVVSSGEKAKAFFDEMLKETEYGAKAYAYSCGEARRLLIERSFDLCVINAPLSDESGEKFATQIIGDKADQVILIVKSELQNLSPASRFLWFIKWRKRLTAGLTA